MGQLLKDTCEMEKQRMLVRSKGSRYTGRHSMGERWGREWLVSSVLAEGLVGECLGLQNPPAMQGSWVRALGWGDPLEKGTATDSTPVFWPGEFHRL